MGEGLARQVETERQRRPARTVQLLQDGGIVPRVDHHQDVGEVLGAPRTRLGPPMSISSIKPVKGVAGFAAAAANG